jgi:hypothetical protein
MKGIELKTGWHRAGALALGAGALFVTVGCGTPAVTTVAGQERGGLAGLPVMVACEPHQRTLVRPVVVNGATVSQVECVAAEVAPASGQAVAAPVAQTQPVFRQLSAASAPVDENDDARIVRTSYPEARPVQTREVVYREPVRQSRSVKKSAIIIGSSAGVGAGVGAAVGGKKGALIGAAIGGGSAAIWDQVTRRK